MDMDYTESLDTILDESKVRNLEVEILKKKSKIKIKKEEKNNKAAKIKI